MIYQPFLQKRMDAGLKELGLKWIAFYEIMDTRASVAAQSGAAPSLKAFELALGNEVLGAEIMEPVRFENTLLGFLAAEGIPGRQKDLASQDLQFLAAQLACFLYSKNRTRAAAIDELVETIHRRHPEKYHWTGVYLLQNNGTLALEAFRGEPTPHVVIPISHGICGAAVRDERIMNVPDVSADPRYLSCSIMTKSEIVVPIFQGGKVVGEIDIDSHVKNAFTPQDERELTAYSIQIASIPF